LGRTSLNILRPFTIWTSDQIDQRATGEAYKKKKRRDTSGNEM
jgi:hypothetical protein